MFWGHPAGHGQYTRGYAWIESQKHRAVSFSGRVAEVVDPARVEIRPSVVVHVDSDLNDPDELHQVHRRLLVSVTFSDGPCSRAGRHGALAIANEVVAVLVDASPFIRDRERTSIAQGDRQYTQGSKTKSNAIDADAGDPVGSEGGSHSP